MKDGSQKPFSFLIIAINDELPAVANEEDALVIFGLRNPIEVPPVSAQDGDVIS